MDYPALRPGGVKPSVPSGQRVRCWATKIPAGESARPLLSSAEVTMPRSTNSMPSFLVAEWKAARQVTPQKRCGLPPPLASRGSKARSHHRQRAI